MENKEFDVVGEITQEIAEIIRNKPDKIIANEKSITHVDKKHSKELEALGLNPLDYIKIITINFNVIRQGKNNSIFLIVEDEHKSNIAVVELTYKYDGEYYLVMTATPMRNSYLKNKKLLWQRNAPI